MKVTIRQKSVLFSFMILICIVSLSYAVYKSIKNLLDSAKWVEHTEQVIYQSGNIFSSAKDIETASRGFVITGDSAFLTPMFNAGNIIFINLEQLRQLVQDNPGQQRRVDSLTFYIHKQLNFSYRAIELRNKQGMATAIAGISTGESNECSVHVRRITGMIQQEENILLNQRKRLNERSVESFNRFSVVLFILMAVFTGLLLIATSNYFLQDKEKEKRAAELIIANKELVYQNEEKEKRAAELIIANKELVYQNEEKEKRAQELIIANKELIFQNKEKEKRAAELIIVNEELKKAEDGIRKLNEELEQKVNERTAQLETVNKDLESFSYSVSHDLRAPIRAINGYALILKEDYSDRFDEDGTMALHSIMHNSTRMGHLIDDLLAFSKLGRKQVSVSEIKMTALVNAVIEELSQGENVNSPELNIGALDPAKGDPSLIKQVWINLISNAIKYSKYKSKAIIEIGCYRKEKLVVYFVKDNGAGFDMLYYDKLFGVFQRLHSQEEFEGTGIGLAIVQKIVHRHNGTVWAESKPDEGTCFYFSLPAINSKI